MNQPPTPNISLDIYKHIKKRLIGNNNRKLVQVDNMTVYYDWNKNKDLRNYQKYDLVIYKSDYKRKEIKDCTLVNIGIGKLSKFRTVKDDNRNILSDSDIHTYETTSEHYFVYTVEYNKEKKAIINDYDNDIQFFNYVDNKEEQGGRRKRRSSRRQSKRKSRKNRRKSNRRRSL